MKFLLGLISEHIREEIEGDIEQRFRRNVETRGLRAAKFRRSLDIIKTMRPGILFRRNPYKKHYPAFMFKNYFVIAIRNVMAHKMNSTINALSLIVGITSALIMISVIRYELSFDQFHTNANRIYRIYRQNPEGFATRQPGIGYPVADVFREEVTSIEKITGIQYYGGAQVDIESNGESRKFREEEGAAFVDHEFFNVLDFAGAGFKWIAGNRKTALSEPFSVVITESLSKKYFGNEAAVGKSIRLEGQLDARITGVVTDLPVNTDIPVRMLISYKTLDLVEGEDRMKDDWNSVNGNHQAFVLLPGNTAVETVEAQFDKVHALHTDKQLSGERKYRLQPLSELHKDPQLGNFNHRTVDRTTIWIIAITGLLLLMVGCINYINIATAQSALRGREIGVRKVLGGQKKQLILQFLSETFVLVVIACVFSLFIAEIVLTKLSGLINVALLKHLFADGFILTSLGILVSTITLLAGLYPAIAISAFGIIDSLKGKVGNIRYSNLLRSSLVVVQFAITQVFLIGAFIVIGQLQYSRKMDLGFDKDLILNVPIPANAAARNDAIRAQVGSNPHVTAMSISSSFPSGNTRNRWFVSTRKKEVPGEQAIIIEYQSIDTAFLGVYGIQMKTGRNFRMSDAEAHTIINKTAAADLGFKNAEEAIGSTIVLDGKDLEVIGVTEDFHTNSTRDKIGPIAFVYKPDFFFTASLKLNATAEDLQDVIAGVEKNWSNVYPDMLFDYEFFDENIEHFYREEKKLSDMLKIFSGVFLTIACLGLYGLLSFVINSRMKEVAVRKVFGAGVMNIVSLISKDYIMLIAISFSIAAPVSYYFMSRWLEGFTFHIPITWWIFVAPGLISMMISLTTLSGKLLKAASQNPAETLKYE